MWLNMIKHTKKLKLNRPKSATSEGINMTSWCPKLPLGIIQFNEMSSNFGCMKHTQKKTKVYFPQKHKLWAYWCHLSLQNIWLNFRKWKQRISVTKVCFHFVCHLLFHSQAFLSTNKLQVSVISLSLLSSVNMLHRSPIRLKPLQTVQLSKPR